MKSDIEQTVENRMVDSAADTESNVIKLKNFLFTEKEVLDCLSRNEVGDAALFGRIMKDKFIYDRIAQSWYYWNDHSWRLDILNEVRSSIDRVTDIYFNEVSRQYYLMSKASEESKNKTAKKHENNIKMLNKRVHFLYSLARKKNVLSLAGEGVGSLCLPGEEWDLNPFLLACKNGVVNLDNGEINPGNPKDYIKSVSPINYNGIEEPCKEWVKFLYTIFDHDEPLIEYIQRLLGYAVTGLSTEHIYPILWGDRGRNGKSTMFEILKHIMGNLAVKAPGNFLMSTKVEKDSSSPDPILMSLRGCRLVWCSETNKGDVLNVAKLKELSGGDTITARGLWARKAIQFLSTHTIFTITNRKPKISASDSAMWKRLHLIPFNLSFVDDPQQEWERKADKDLQDKLKKEAPGILAWLARGYQLYKKHGLNPPKTVLDASRQYRNEEDIIGHFVEDRCIILDSSENAKTSLSDLYSNYQDWCEEVGHRKMSKKNFSTKMERKFKKIKVSTIHFKDIIIGEKI